MQPGFSDVIDVINMPPSLYTPKDGNGVGHTSCTEGRSSTVPHGGETTRVPTSRGGDERVWEPMQGNSAQPQKGVERGHMLLTTWVSLENFMLHFCF